MQEAPDIEFERDWPVGLGATLEDGQIIKNYFSSFTDFSDSVILLGFECTINPQNLIKAAVLPKSRSSISNSGTKGEVLLR